MDDLFLPLALVLLLGGAYAYLMFAVMHGRSLAAWDGHLGSWVAGQSTPWGKRFFAFITGLGTYRAVRTLAALIAVWLVFQRDWLRLAMLLVLCAAAIFINNLLKRYYRRRRPAFQAHTLKDFSFPSGHTMLATGFYLMVAYLGWSYAGSSPLGWALVALALALVVLIGFSRFYLGVHFMTDVLGGWTAGGLIFLIVLLAGKLAWLGLHLH